MANLNFSFRFIEYLMKKISIKREFLFGIRLAFFVYYFTIVYCACFYGDFSSWGKSGKLGRQRKQNLIFSFYDSYVNNCFYDSYVEEIFYLKLKLCFPV